LPLEVAPLMEAPKIAHASVSHERLDGLRILIVDDSPDNQLLMKRMLDRAGAMIHVAANGMEAVCAASESQYDAILMDMQMPILDGLSATRQLRERGYQKPIIALTAHALPEEREKCFLAGCDEHISKPVDFRKLKEILAGMPRYLLESRDRTQGSGSSEKRFDPESLFSSRSH
ncbi:MAG: response regulator, partial [Bdellovibrionaceae bacterium]|nr:response regulator [Pseudobdellovibrionaceae bacterium]